MARAWRASEPKLLKLTLVQFVEGVPLACSGRHTGLEGCHSGRWWAVRQGKRLQAKCHQRLFAQKFVMVKLEKLSQIVGTLMESGPNRGALKTPIQTLTKST